MLNGPNQAKVKGKQKVVEFFEERCIDPAPCATQNYKSIDGNIFSMCEKGERKMVFEQAVDLQHCFEQ